MKKHIGSLVLQVTDTKIHNDVFNAFAKNTLRYGFIHDKITHGVTHPIMDNVPPEAKRDITSVFLRERRLEP